MTRYRSSSFTGLASLIALTPSILAAEVYQSTHICGPSNFLDCFNFYTGADPTNGFVQYVDRDYASSNGLVRSTSENTYVGTDTTNTISLSSPGRPSVRLESSFTQTHGLYILSLTHMPFGCATWPAFWTLGADWPNTGEIDIIEGANTATRNLASLHTNNNCTIAGQGETGTLMTNDCNIGASNTGCGVQDPRAASYGDGFNRARGGIYAMEWTSTSIRVWFFPRGATPRSVTSGQPNPGKDFGTPMANFAGSCDIDSHFRSHKIIFDLTFCGDYAGNVYGSSGCPIITGKTSKESCNAYVANNPSALEDAYWEIESLKVYQLKSLPGSSSIRSTKSKTSTRLSSVKPVASTSSLSSHSLAMGASTTKKESSSLPTRKTTTRHVSSSTARSITRTTKKAKTSSVKSSSKKTSTRPKSTTMIKPSLQPSVGSRVITHAPLPTSEPRCGETFSIATLPPHDAAAKEPETRYEYAVHCNATFSDSSITTHNMQLLPRPVESGTANEPLNFAACVAQCDAYGTECGALAFTNGTIPSAEDQCTLYSKHIVASERTPSQEVSHTALDRVNSESAAAASGARDVSAPSDTAATPHQLPEREHRRHHRRRTHASPQTQQRQDSSLDLALQPKEGSYVALRLPLLDDAVVPAPPVAELRTATTRVHVNVQSTVWVTEIVEPTTCTDLPVVSSTAA